MNHESLRICDLAGSGSSLFTATVLFPYAASIAGLLLLSGCGSSERSAATQARIDSAQQQFLPTTYATTTGGGSAGTGGSTSGTGNSTTSTTGGGSAGGSGEASATSGSTPSQTASLPLGCILLSFLGTCNASNSSVAAPVPSVPTGIYGAAQTLQFTGPNQAAIFYTTDGASPTTASKRYVSAITVATSQTVKSISVVNGGSSSMTSVVLVILPQVQVAVSPRQVLLGPAESRSFAADVTGAPAGTVLWSISPAVGTINAQGLYTAPAKIGSATSVTVKAVSLVNPTRSASGTVALQQQPSTLRSLASARGLLVGAAVDASEFNQPSLLADSRYAGVLKAEYNMVEGENAMKWMVIGANQGVYDFGPGDEIVSFAKANDMVVRGHNLCWNAFNPAWLSSLSSPDLSKALHDYIFATMSHFKGKVFAWDVVNEAISDTTTASGTQMKSSLWYDSPGIGQAGTKYVEQAFRWARQADPTAKLFYNEYSVETPGAKSQALLNMLRDFIARGIPIDGVGLQMHVDTKDNYPKDFPAMLKKYTDLGLEVHITEMDVRLPVDKNGNSSAADLQAQAGVYRFVLDACLANTRCTALQTWGFTDAHSWIPSAVPSYGNALPFDVQYRPKASVETMKGELQEVQ